MPKHLHAEKGFRVEVSGPAVIMFEKVSKQRARITIHADRSTKIDCRKKVKKMAGPKLSRGE